MKTVDIEHGGFRYLPSFTTKVDTMKWLPEGVPLLLGVVVQTSRNGLDCGKFVFEF